MGVAALPAAAFGSHTRHAVLFPGRHHVCSSNYCLRSHDLKHRGCSLRKRSNWLYGAWAVVFSIPADSGDTFMGTVDHGNGDFTRSEVPKIDENEATLKEKDQLLIKLAQSDVDQQKYVSAIMHNKELAFAELKAVNSLFNQDQHDSIEDKFTLESKLVLEKQDAVELAVQVEKLAEIAFQQATSHILKDAQVRILAAETSAADLAFKFEDEIRNATECMIIPIIEQSKDAIQKALAVAERAEQAHAMENASELRASAAERSLHEFQESIKEKSVLREHEVKSVIEEIEKDAADGKKAVSQALKVELDGIKGAIEASKRTAHLKDEAYMKRCEALNRSLKASEAASKIWRHRAEMAESLKEGEQDIILDVNGGRIDLWTANDSQKWKLLSDGPRREIPKWMAQRIRTICPNLQPRKIDVSEASMLKFKTLNLPKSDNVWSIAKEKQKEGDELIEHVIEKNVLDEKRKALEHTLQRKNIQWQKTPDQTKLASGTGTGREIVLQGFNWESWRKQWYQELAPKAADLSNSGITAVWFPPPTESVAPQGYMPSDLYNLNSAYGSEDELRHCIKEMHCQDLLALGDAVLNHRCAHKQSPNGVWNIFGGKLAWDPKAIVCDDPNFQGQGNPSSGDIFHAAPNIDHSQQFVRNDIKEWLNWLRSDIGFDGWRLDFVRGFSGSYVKEYIEASNPAFAIGEYWDSLSYEGGDLCYNQDAHRQRIINWINATGGTSSAFDVTTKGILHSALHNQYWRLIDPQGKPTGVMGWWPSRAVTFLENHDTGSTQGHWPFPREKLSQGYAYILSHPGTPVIFYDHFYDFGIRDVITELIEARRRAGIHCRSAVKIYHANNEGYVAEVGERLVMKLGHFDWNPSKENHLEGSWHKFLNKGSDYQVWLKQ